MITHNINIREAQRKDAKAIATLIIQAMTEECCRFFCGYECTMDDYRQLLTELTEREDTQYSYRNTLCAVNEEDSVVGIAVSYDGSLLHQLRQPFFDAIRTRYGRDVSHIDDETQAGELYLDSLAVNADFQGQGIATRLLQATVQKANDSGIGVTGLLVDDNNPKAERLYIRCGFRQVGINTWGGHPMKHLQR